MKLRIGKRAQREAARAEAWWGTNRPASPHLFTRELEETFAHICAVPGAGVPWPTAARPSLRRILMPRARNHVYFRVDARAQVVHVMAIWGAPRGTAPKL